MDDILVYRQDRYRNEIICCMHQGLDCIFSWRNDSNAIINLSKSTVTWFSVNNHIINTDMPAVELCDVVARTNLTMYLGVKLDRSLCFKEHAYHVLTKAHKRI